MLVRTWNLFHGNSVPPGHTDYLEEMVRLASADRPTALLLQEVPPWAFRELESWSGMAAFTQPGRRAPFGDTIGEKITRLDPGLLRSAFAGQGNAILLDRALEPFDYHALVLNPHTFRREQAARFRLGLLARLAWARERRVLQVIRAARPDGRRTLVANLHATYYARDRRLAEAELSRAAEFFLAIARPGEIDVFGGDFNLLAASGAIRSLREQGLSAPGRGVDHVLVRGAVTTPPERWPDERRTIDGVLLSDHAPVEVQVQ
jgi:endonuclease/exonuclease/phosphatase family metal-dependent hydrolase